jgi:hypothetical protein
MAHTMPEESKSRQAEAPPPRRNRSEPVARGAMALGADALARAGFRDPTLVLRWGEIAGPEVARIAQPLRLSQSPTGAVLTLRAEPGAALFLQHESRPLLERVNAYLGGPAITRLKFVQAPLGQAPVRRRPQPKPAADVPENDPASTFQGPEPVRNALIRLARWRAARHRPD